LRKVVDRNDGPLTDDVLVRLFREVMSACLAQQEPLKIGYLGPEGTFSQQAVHKHFGHSAHGLPLASIEEVFQEVAAGNADFGVVPVENSGQGTIQVHARPVPDLAVEDLRRSRAARAPAPAVAQRPHRGYRTHLRASAGVRADRPGCARTCRRREDPGIEQCRSRAPRPQRRRRRGHRR
jgi:hypothetical protein